MMTQKRLAITRGSVILTALLVTVFEVGVVQRETDQVGLVLIKLGGGLILQLWNFCLVVLPDVDTAGE